MYDKKNTDLEKVASEAKHLIDALFEELKNTRTSNRVEVLDLYKNGSENYECMTTIKLADDPNHSYYRYVSSLMSISPVITEDVAHKIVRIFANNVLFSGEVIRNIFNDSVGKALEKVYFLTIYDYMEVLAKLFINPEYLNNMVIHINTQVVRDPELAFIFPYNEMQEKEKVFAYLVHGLYDMQKSHISGMDREKRLHAEKCLKRLAQITYECIFILYEEVKET